jgi:beta-glucosidase
MQGQASTKWVFDLDLIDPRVNELLEKMTLAEKVGQMTQPEINSVTPQDVTDYALGSILSGGGGNPTPNNASTWREMVISHQKAALKTRLGIPLIYGSDAVHGHSNVVGTVIFPHNIGLGATRDADLVRRIAQITAKELLATSVHWNFAPAVSVPQDIRWGRTYEGYSEDTQLVSEMGVACTEGLHEAGVLASVKHYLADGGTTWGTTQSYEWITGNWQAPNDGFSIDQGDTRIDEATLRRVHLQPYIETVNAGALNIMTSFSSWNGDKMHGHTYLVQDVLKGELGFDGFIVSDWMAINQLNRDYYTCVVKAINAGVDMNMVPFDFKLFIETLTRAVEKGDVSIERIDDAVRRILRVKVWLGMFDAPFGDAALIAEVGSAKHRELAREAVQKSLVLLKNEKTALPLPRATSRLLLAGRGADNIGMQCGGWTVDWQGGHGPITQGTSILDALQAELGAESILYSENGEFTERAEIGIVVIGEEPYAEGLGDNNDLTLSDEDVATIEKTRAQCDRLVVVLLSGRPLLIADALKSADAFVAAWLPGTEAAGIVDVLLGVVPFSGKLSHSWPLNAEQIPLKSLREHEHAPLFPFGFGLA